MEKVIIKKKKKRTSRVERVSLIAQLVKNLPAMQETPVPFLGWIWDPDLLEKGWATHFSIIGLPLWLS